MARKNPVPLREREIGSRLREFRSATKLSRVAFSRELGIDSTTFASYEYGRVPIPFAVAKCVGEKFNLSLSWLATGQGQMLPFQEMHPNLLSKIHPRALFSVEYENYLKEELNFRQLLASKLKSSTLSVTHLTPVGTPLHENVSWLLKKEIDEVFCNLVFDLQLDLSRKIHDAIDDFLSKHRISLRKK